MNDLAEDPVLKDAAMMCGGTAETIETMWGVIHAAALIWLRQWLTRGAVNTVQTLNKQRAITRTLKNNRGRKVIGNRLVSNTEAVAAACITLPLT